jgi:hypothetical protein
MKSTQSLVRSTKIAVAMAVRFDAAH